MKDAGEENPGAFLIAVSSADNLPPLRIAADFAHRSGSKILLAGVAAAAGGRDGASACAAAMPPQNDLRMRKELEHLALHPQWQGALCEPIMLHSDPCDQIVSLCRNPGLQLIVLAVPGIDGLCRWSNPCLACQLLHKIDVPVMTFGPHVRPLHLGEDSGGRILLPLSLRNDRAEYVDFASRIAGRSGMRLSLLHVANTPEGIGDKQKAAILNRAQMQLAAAACRVDTSIRIETLVSEGDVVRSILQHSICPPQDLIVMGAGWKSPGAAARKQLLHQVNERAPCPAITVTSGACSDRLAVGVPVSPFEQTLADSPPISECPPAETRKVS